MWETREDVLDKTDLKEPPMYKVLLNNDDYTPMDFVVMVLMKIFHRSEQDAYAIMMNVHKQGKGLCGVYTFEVAEAKVRQVEALSHKHKYPLLCTMEQD